MSFRTLDDLDPAGRRVLVRVDLNVPTEKGAVTDGTRLRRITPTLEELADKGARVILLSHFGRPKGRDEKDSLAPVARALGEVMGREIAFAADCTGPEATEAVAGLRDGGILCLENTRFHRGEEENDPDFVEALAALGDAYVNDAFSAAHRAHASTEGLARQLPAYAGRAMQRELEALDAALGNPKRPVLAIVGGSKVSTKLDLLVNLVGKVQMLVIGGGMANTFLHAKGVAIGRSLAERDLGGTARHILDTAARKGCEVILPVDAVVAATLAPDVATSTVPIEAVPADTMILDMGPLSAAAVNAAIDRAATLVWNGPLGAFETPPFEQATVVAARHAAERTAKGALVSVAGGGDTVAALAMAGVTDRITYLSTAGGAFLEWMEGKTLPGVAALG